MLLKQSTKNALKCIYLEEKCRNAKLVNIHRIALQIHLNKHSLIKNEACFKYSTSFLSLSLSLKVLVVYSTMESSNRHNPTRERHLIMRTCILSPAFVCVRICAHIVCPCIHPLVGACISVCMHVWVCVVNDDSTPGVPSAGAPREISVNSERADELWPYPLL